ncbi:MAG: hypothetical protein ACLSUM_00775 [Dysosmobacter welbionis]
MHYDHYEVGLSDNDFLPVTNKAGESYRYLALVYREPRTQLGPGLLSCFCRKTAVRIRRRGPA